MPVIKLTEYDILTERLRLTLEDIAKSDICDPDEDFPDFRSKAQAELRSIVAQASIAGYTEGELYRYVIGAEEARAAEGGRRRRRRGDAYDSGDASGRVHEAARRRKSGAENG